LEKLKKFNFLVLVKRNGLVIAFIIFFIVFSLSSNTFLSERNVFNVLRQQAVVGIIACAVTVLLIAGKFDLSVGSILSLSAVLVVDLHEKIAPVPAILITLIVAMLIGILNGFLVGFLKLNAFVITLGMLTTVGAIPFIYTGGHHVQILGIDDVWFGFLGRGKIGPFPSQVILFIIFAIITSIFLARTVTGRRIYAIGGNEVTAKYSGIQDGKLIMCLYIFSAISAAIGGILLASRVGGAQNAYGTGYEFEVLAAVILGGSSINGGSGSIIKTVLGVLLLGFVNNGLIMIGFDYWIQWIVEWGVIILAVCLDILARKGGQRVGY
jgi:ribose transport system permease protein